jgi:L-rhamnose isomerase/sugar isomerase
MTGRSAVSAAKRALKSQAGLTPSWASGDSGTDGYASLAGACANEVRPPVARVRAELGGDAEPVTAYHPSGHGRQLVADGVGGSSAGRGA